jgi:hypothetical protein
MKNSTHFKNRIDMLDDKGEVLEHLADFERFELAEAMPEGRHRALAEITDHAAPMR